MKLTPRLTEIATLVAKGHPNKAIAQKTGLTVRTVETYIERAADQLPGDSYPRSKLTLWFFSLRKTPDKGA